MKIRAWFSAMNKARKDLVKYRRDILRMAWDLEEDSDKMKTNYEEFTKAVKAIAQKSTIYGESPLKKYYDAYFAQERINNNYRSFMANNHRPLRTKINAEFTGRNEDTMTAQQWMTKHGLEIGDKVGIYRPDWEWHGWCKGMNKTVGQTFTIKGDNLNSLYLSNDFFYRPCCLEPVPKPTPTHTLDTAAIKKRFSRAVVVGCNKDRIAILVPVEHMQYVDIVTGTHWTDHDFSISMEWVIRPGNKCTDRTGFYTFTYTGFSGDLEYPFAGLDHEGKDCFRSIRPLPSPTPEQKQRQKRIEQIEKKIGRIAENVSNGTRNLEHLKGELKKLKNL